MRVHQVFGWVLPTLAPRHKDGKTTFVGVEGRTHSDPKTTLEQLPDPSSFQGILVSRGLATVHPFLGFPGVPI